MQRGVRMCNIKSKSNAKCIKAINEACFGLHGELSNILQTAHHFFYCKNRKNSELLLNIVLSNIVHLIVLNKLITYFGETSVFLKLEKNSWSYYKLNYTKNVKCKQVVLDAIIRQRLSINNYQNILLLTDDEKVREIVEKLLLESNKNIQLLNETIK